MSSLRRLVAFPVVLVGMLLFVFCLMALALANMIDGDHDYIKDVEQGFNS